MKTTKINNEYTKIICILDRSTSMGVIIDQAINGFNEFLIGQQNCEGKASMTTVMFDSSYEKLYENIDIHKVEKFNRKTYSPRGCTALYDAIGVTIDEEIDNLGEITLKDRPDKTLCVILTDGEENSSKQYNQSKIKTLVDDMKENFNWEFIFLAANQDAALAATSIGISTGNSMTFDYSDDGINAAYTTLNVAASNFRSASKGVKTDSLIEDIEE